MVWLVAYFVGVACLFTGAFAFHAGGRFNAHGVFWAAVCWPVLILLVLVLFILAAISEAADWLGRRGAA